VGLRRKIKAAAAVIAAKRPERHRAPSAIGLRAARAMRQLRNLRLRGVQRVRVQKGRAAAARARVAGLRGWPD
jgi:hypothetical protein